MKIAKTVGELRASVANFRSQGERIALVPTMGNLHAGHLSLVAQARQVAERVIVSVFVNPAQFGPSEDFDRYPRTPEADLAALESVGTDMVFMPKSELVYPRGVEHMAQVEVPRLSDRLCGQSRIGHFRGVTTVVLKLLHMATPDHAFFGKKDFQQLLLIQRMVSDLDLAIEVHGASTVREPDGLAMSSRNTYLSAFERARAPLFYRELLRIRDQVALGSRDYHGLGSCACAALEAEGFKVDYLELLRSEDLEMPEAGEDPVGLRVFGAVWLGGTRLIDNVSLSAESD